METERNLYCKPLIPFEALEIIENSVYQAILPLSDDDPLTAQCLGEIEKDYKESQYYLLNWLKKTCSPNKILYAGSGSDILPKYVFGEDKVFHTSLEGFLSDDKKYFPDLGSGIKVIANNLDFPFQNSSFDIILFFGLRTDTTEIQLAESIKLLSINGLIVCDNIVSCDNDLSNIFPNFSKIKVPEYFQNKGVSETNFQVFRKDLFS